MHSPPSIISSGFANHALQMLQKVQHGMSPIELVYTTHERWPLRPGHFIHTRPTLRISILDSSFNPPTLAHLALANSLPPQRSPVASVSADPYDARMLLLSVRNADKVLKPDDATLVQRLEMMRLLSHDIRSTESSSESSLTSDNVAVAIIDEPMFFGKSTVILRFLQTRLDTVIGSSIFPQSLCGIARDPSHQFPSPRLTFLLGFDTLVRLFSPRYYPSEQAMIQVLRTLLSSEGCRIVCAHRQCVKPETSQETQALEVAREFIRSDRIAFIDIGREEQTYSSSEVRAQVQVGDGKWRQFVTDVVANYIIEQGIYSGLEKKD